jgi:beta-aspartyl-peptidase (threonine type)
MQNRFAIALHGGAGVIEKTEDSSLHRDFEAALAQCLKVGTDILQDGGTSIDAVEATVTALEDHPLFNAGRGAVFNHDGFHERTPFQSRLTFYS